MNISQFRWWPICVLLKFECIELEMLKQVLHTAPELLIFFTGAESYFKVSPNELLFLVRFY